MNRVHAIGFSAIIFAASPAFAQSAATPVAASAQPGTNDNGGIRKAASANMAVRFLDVQTVDLMATKLIGANVYNKQNESLGEIEDLVLDNGKTVSGVVVSVGGFLGIGEHYVLIDPSTLVVQVTDGTTKAFIDSSKDNLKNAPKFTYTRKQPSSEALSFLAKLKASSEAPPNESQGAGNVDAKFDPSSKTLSWTVTYSNLTGPASAAHFHGPAEPGKNAPPVIPIKGGLTSPIKGSETLTDAQAADLKAGRWYFNIHTAAHKDGEVRGQLSK